MASLEEIRKRFQGDRFATQALGGESQEAEPGRAVCALRLEPRHMNENNVPMGGVVFTLADLAFAVAANGYSDHTTVTQQASLTFLAPAQGRVLRAQARCLKEGRRTSLYQVEVADELGTLVAYGTINGYTL